VNTRFKPPDQAPLERAPAAGETAIDPDSIEFLAATVNGRRCYPTAKWPFFLIPLESFAWPPVFSVQRIKQRRRHSFIVSCPICEEGRAYAFDPFCKGGKLFSLARDCPRRIAISDREIPPSSALRGWICPAAFWRRRP
jgi:hypothetical protein